jgi:hypothetical protein
MAIEKYQFKDEPFKPELDVPMHGREIEWAALDNFFENSLTGNRIRSFLLIGDYGFGKSFLLHKIREEFNKEKSIFNKNNDSLCVSIVLAETEPASSISFEYVTNIFKDLGEEKLIEIAQKKHNIKKSLFSKNYKKIIQALQKEEEEAYQWLIGESLTSEAKKIIGVNRKFHPNESLTIMMDFLRFIKMSGYNNLVVLLDEFEYAINVYSEKKLTSLFHTFKNIHDKFVEGKGSVNFAKHIQIIAITAKGYDVINDLELKMRTKTGGGGITPWLERMHFEANQVSIGPLGKEDAKQLLIDRLNNERMKNSKVEFPTFPFIHPSYFNTIIEVSERIPRYLLDYSEIVLEEAARRNLNKIDGKIAREILEDYGIIKKKELPE